VIHRPQNEYVHVAKVAGDEVRHDVALAIRQDFIAAGEPLQNQMDVIGSFASLMMSVRAGTRRLSRVASARIRLSSPDSGAKFSSFRVSGSANSPPRLTACHGMDTSAIAKDRCTPARSARPSATAARAQRVALQIQSSPELMKAPSFGTAASQSRLTRLIAAAEFVLQLTRRPDRALVLCHGFVEHLIQL
jgi:hypothetical protein